MNTQVSRLLLLPDHSSLSPKFGDKNNFNWGMALSQSQLTATQKEEYRFNLLVLVMV